MSPLQSFRAIIDIWPTKEALAEDVGATVEAVSKWRQRDSIPSDWWAVLTSSTLARRSGVTAELLTRLAARESVR